MIAQVPTKYMQLHLSQYHREAMMQQVPRNLLATFQRIFLLSYVFCHIFVQKVKQQFSPPQPLLRPAKKYDYGRAPNNQMKRSPTNISIRPLARSTGSSSSTLNSYLLEMFFLDIFLSSPSFRLAAGPPIPPMDPCPTCDMRFSFTINQLWID